MTISTSDARLVEVTNPSVLPAARGVDYSYSGPYFAVPSAHGPEWSTLVLHDSDPRYVAMAMWKITETDTHFPEEFRDGHHYGWNVANKDLLPVQSETPGFTPPEDVDSLPKLASDDLAVGDVFRWTLIDRDRNWWARMISRDDDNGDIQAEWVYPDDGSMPSGPRSFGQWSSASSVPTVRAAETATEPISEPPTESVDTTTDKGWASTLNVGDVFSWGLHVVWYRVTGKNADGINVERVAGIAVSESAFTYPFLVTFGKDNHTVIPAEVVQALGGDLDAAKREGRREAEREFEEWRQRATEIAHQYADDNSLCGEFDRCMEEVGLEPRNREYEVTVTEERTYTFTMTARDSDDAYNEARDRYTDLGYGEVTDVTVDVERA
jgi:hypothetical protein